VKTIGLLGGMSWESSIEYYRIINQVVRQRLGGLHSARSLMYSLNVAELVLQPFPCDGLRCADCSTTPPPGYPPLPTWERGARGVRAG
jgi:hypothetical protein